MSFREHIVIAAIGFGILVCITLGAFIDNALGR